MTDKRTKLKAPKGSWSRWFAKALWSILITLGCLTGVSAVAAMTESFVKSQVPAMLPSGKHFFADNWDQGYFQARGTWVIDNDKIANPLNTSEIICSLASQECVEASSELWSLFGYSLNGTANIRSIDAWTRDTITFHDAGACATYTVTINRVTQSITGIRVRNPNAPLDVCKLASSENKLTSLQDGFPISQRLEKEARNKVLPFFWIGVALLVVFSGFAILRVWKRKASDALNTGEGKIES